MDVGENIRKARKIKGLTQVDVAEMAEIAVNSLRLYEAGKRTPNLEQLQHIAGAIGVEWTSLVDGEFIWDDEFSLPPKEKEKIDKARKKALFDIQNSLLLSTSDSVEDHAKLDEAFQKLNSTGRKEAVKRVEELTEIPRYRAETAPQSPPAPPEGKDTPTGQNAAEGAEEGE